MDMVLVEWGNATEEEGSVWFGGDDDTELGMAVCRNVGFLWEQDESSITLVHGMCDDGGRLRRFLIPRGMVRSMKILQTVKDNHAQIDINSIPAEPVGFVHAHVPPHKRV